MPGANLILIGMPGSGKTTLGMRLARAHGLKFVDTDFLIEQRFGYPLEKLKNRHGPAYIRRIEERTLTSLALENYIIATGGSAVYSERAMSHLQEIGRIAYLHISLATLLARVKANPNRGLVISPHHSLQVLYHQRLPLYRRWAELTIDNNWPLTAWQFDRILQRLTAAAQAAAITARG